MFLERRLPCSGIADVFQRRGMVKKVTAPDSVKGGGGTKRQILAKGEARAPGAPPVPPPMYHLIRTLQNSPPLVARLQCIQV